MHFACGWSVVEGGVEETTIFVDFKASSPAGPPFATRSFVKGVIFATGKRTQKKLRYIDSERGRLSPFLSISARSRPLKRF